MADKKSPLIVFFNASVIISGLKSPKGGSAKLLSWVKKGKIHGIISEIVVDEIRKHADRVGITADYVEKVVHTTGLKISPAPGKDKTLAYEKRVIDAGDAHILSSSDENKVKYLVTLDKKHLLVLKDKIQKFKIVSPKEFIERIVENAQNRAYPPSLKL